MIRAGILAAVLAVVLGVSVSGLPSAGKPKWRMAFSDDFSKGLDRSRWAVYSGRPGGDPGGWWAPSHVAVSHHALMLETYRDPEFGGRWVSGGVSSAPALAQTYGKYEVTFRVGAGRGVDAVLLLWPADNRWPPEIDFAENAGTSTDRDWMTATLHYGVGNHQLAFSVRADFSRWHTIGVQWTPQRLVYTLDGRTWARLKSDHVPSRPMVLDMQSQAGTCGQRYFPCPDRTTPRDVVLEVRRVVAYALQRR
jgi:beta-glucanase (GH16 family)